MHPAVPVRERVQTSTPLSGLLRLFAFHDVVMLWYLAMVAIAILVAPGHVDRAESARATLGTMAALVAACTLSRGTQIGPVWLRSTVYRVTMAGAVIGNYLALKRLLPVVRPDNVDAQLAAIDHAVFGLQPAVWLERYSTPTVVETLAFFYFGYFFICSGYMIASLWIAPRNRSTTEWAIGTAMVFCIGQLGYMAVPAFGPVVHFHSAFAGPLEGGFFWNAVQSTVAASGAQKDVFPSLHTAAPLWFALHAARRSQTERVWRIPAVITGIFSFMIIISTVVLRWHYVVDVVAGIALATSAAFLAPRIAEWSERIRLAHAARTAWEM